MMKTQEKAGGWEPGGQGQEGGRVRKRELGWSIGLWKAVLSGFTVSPSGHALVCVGWLLG